MQTFSKLLLSSVGKKFLMALSGLALVGFLGVHLLGNLTLLIPGSETFNTYAMKLHSIGPVLMLVAELGLLFLFCAHIFLALQLKISARGARPVKYLGEKTKTEQAPSPVVISRNMIVTGAVIAVFLVLHIYGFRFGPSIEQGYVADLNGVQVRDLYRLVLETFKNPFIVGFYVFVMILLGGHLRHGFWSSFQSLGLAFPRYNCAIRCLGIGLAVLMSVGFLIIPVAMYLFY